MNLSKSDLIDIYKQMVLIRICEDSFIDPILNGDIKCPVHLCSGQEAIAVGFSLHLKNSDQVFGNHRSHGHYLAKGGSLKELVAEVYCRESGCSGGRGGSMHLISKEAGFSGSAPIVGGTIPLALGAALAHKIKGNGNISVCYFGDGATGEGVLYEAMNFARIYDLPLIFLCENNYYATHMPYREIHSDRGIISIPHSLGIEAVSEDGNDVLKVIKQSQKAIRYSRSGNGPYFLEFLTYRLRGHVGPDDNIHGSHTDIRPEEEILRWKKKDPIKYLRKYILENSITNLAEIEEIHKLITEQIVEAHNDAICADYPPKHALNKNVFKKTIS